MITIVEGVIRKLILFAGMINLDSACTITDLWSGKVVGRFSGEFAPVINRHGAGLFKLEIEKESSSKN